MSAPATARRIGIGVALLLTAGYGCNDAATPLEPRHHGQPSPLIASVIVVTNTDDAGPGSLRQAILDAVNGDVIQFDPSIAGGTIALSTGQLTIDKMLTIEGPLPGGMTISGGLASRVFAVSTTGNAAFRNLSVVNGRARNGGGMLVEGKAMLDHMLVANNESDSLFAGGIYVKEGDLTLVNSTVSGNVARTQGGGIVAHGPTVGGPGTGAVSIRNSTITQNTARDGGGVFAFNILLSVRNSIIANNIDTENPANDANCKILATGQLIFLGRNMSNDDTCGPDPALILADPLLGPLANNGGPTNTHALLFGSPAIDAGTVCTEATDQRYVARNQGTSCDIGAFEFDAFRTISLTIGPNVAVDKQTGVATVTGTISCVGPAPTPLGISLSQTQKITGKFTTIIQAQANIPATCTSTPSSWSVALTPATGKFKHGAATGSATVLSAPSGYVLTTVTASLKLF